MTLKTLAVSISLALLPLSYASAQVRQAEGIGFYVGIDGRVTVPTGSFAGLAEANAGRLTLLLDYGSNHFHAIGTYSYTGPAPHPGVRDTNRNNRIPEISSNEAPVPLTAGSSLYDGKLRSNVGFSEYSNLGVTSIQTLAGFGAGSPENILLNSSGGRWASSLSGVTVGLKLLSATAGLSVGTESVSNLFSSSDTILLGHGNTFEFKPVYWVEGSAASGTYSAEFQLVNLNPLSPYEDSGRFYFDFSVATAPVPEPGAYAMMLCGLGMLGLAMRRRARKASAKTIKFV